MQNSAYYRLADQEILRICRTAAIIGPMATVSGVGPGPDGTLHATLSEPFPDQPRITRVIVNASTRQLAAFDVEGE
jgi:hypothetical protein